jgi:tetratricopeptide (TPR) repeat protein
MARWKSVSSRSNRYVNVSVSVGLLALLAGCHSAPARPMPAVAPSAEPAAVVASTSNATPTTGTGVNSPAQLPIPERAAQQYSQALQLMKTGRGSDAELEFKQLSVAYPQFAGPDVNLGLLYLHDSRLPEAQGAFEAALARNPANLVAGNELGIVLRKLGKFAQAEAAYQRTIAVDPNYAPVHLNLGVLYDLYLGQPQKALDEFQRYIDIAGENKQVGGWVVELRKRVGAPAAAPKKEPA